MSKTASTVSGLPSRLLSTRHPYQDEERQPLGVKERELPEVGAARNRDPHTSPRPKGRSRVRPTGWRGPICSCSMNKRRTQSQKQSKSVQGRNLPRAGASRSGSPQTGPGTTTSLKELRGRERVRAVIGRNRDSQELKLYGARAQLNKDLPYILSPPPSTNERRPTG